MMKKFALSWITFFALAILIAHFNQYSIESHVLPQTLQFGYDAFGRNCLSLVLVAAFQSIKLIVPSALTCIGLAFISALLISLTRRQSTFWMRAILDTLSSLPGFLIALALSVFFPNSEITLMIATFFMIFPWLTRFFESHLIQLKLADFISAAHALGSSPSQTFTTHYLPELVRLLISILPYLLTRLLLVETSLSFLGIGSAPEHETWGRLLYQGRDYLSEAPWILALTGIPLCLTLFSLHLLTREDRI
jgi:peptide/nickel transport system permease protein